jgi:hypothetical protein
MTLIDQDMIDTVNTIIGSEAAGSAARKNLEERLSPILNNKGKCVECGRSGDLPCDGMDFDGCMVAEGFMLDQDVVRFWPLLAEFFPSFQAACAIPVMNHKHAVCRRQGHWYIIKCFYQ